MHDNISFFVDSVIESIISGKDCWLGVHFRFEEFLIVVNVFFFEHFAKGSGDFLSYNLSYTHIKFGISSVNPI